MGVIVVTGAGGFIGRALCARLQHDGRPYRAVVRFPSQHAHRHPQEWVVPALDTATHDELMHAVQGASAVVHLAARSHVMRESAPDPLAAYRAANVEATLRLARAAVTAQVPRFILASSVKVHGESSPRGRPLTPGSPLKPADAYARSKVEAEAVVRATCASTATVALIVRLPLVYGPGVRGNFLALLDAVAAEQLLPLGAIVNRRSMLYVDNFVDATLAALDAARPVDGAHFMSDGEAVSTPELVRAVALALDEPVRLLRVPLPILRTFGAMTGRGKQIARLTGSLEVDATSFMQATGWRPAHELQEGLAATAAWWRTRHSI